MREEAERAKEDMEHRLFQLQDEARMANDALVRVFPSLKLSDAKIVYFLFPVPLVIYVLIAPAV